MGIPSQKGFVQMESSPGATGDLEGSTLGRKSRDDSQPGLRTNRNQTSGGFLLDSSYSGSSRRVGSASQHAQQTPSSDGEKRRHADDEIVVSKKRSPSYRGTEQHQSQQRRSLKTSPLAAVTNVSTPEGHQNEPAAASRHVSSSNLHSSNVGLDTDPVQIVNLALNLSESRRRTTVGRVPSSPLPGIARNHSSNQGRFSICDNAHRPLAANKGQRHSSLYTQDNRYSRNGLPPKPPLAHEPLTTNHGTVGILPIPDQQDVEISCSQATLVRIQKAKQHFELFSNYLELLSYLPPLQHSPHGAQSAGGRVYNPLQAIRNRKIRSREKSVIDIESEGWQNVSRVDNWLASVKATNEHNPGDPYECLTLPPYPKDHDDTLMEQQEAWNPATTSPLSNARETARSGTKPQRPRQEWIISPAELLADAFWLESGSNKAKIVDKDGERLFPDPSKLKFDEPPPHPSHAGAVHQNEHLSLKQPFTPMGLSNAKRESLPGPGPGHQWSKSYGTQPTSNPATSAENVYAPKWTRSNSLSDGSSSDEVISRGRSRRANRRRKIKSEAAMQAEKLHRVLKKGRSDSSNADPRRSNPLSKSSSVKTGEAVDKSHVLISPAGSVTGKEDRRMSVDEMDSTAPNSPAQGPIFPSITVNLSPPSSRSPSPRKKLPRVFESLHERTKSRRYNHLEQGEGPSESPLEFTPLRKKPTADISPKDAGSPKVLEPSPLPEISHSQEDAFPDDMRKMESHGVSKPYASHESKLKGFLRNSRIAEIVGSEVSKVGDLIRRKEGNGHSRQSSYASSIISDYHESDEEGSDGASVPSKQTSLHKGNTFSDDDSSVDWRKPNREAINLPSLGPLNDQNESAELNSLHPSESSRVSNVHFVRAHPRFAPTSSVDSTPYSERRNSYGFRALSKEPSTDRRLKLQSLDNDISPPTIRPIRPPVTGLARAEASIKRRPTLPAEDTGWRLSDRSIPTVTDPNIVEKREVARYQAFLLSSGIKASALVHRFEQPRVPPPKFLVQSLMDKNAPIPRVSRIDEFNYAARNLLERLETTKTNLNKTMYRFSKTTLLPLEKEIDILEDLINTSLTPRVRTAAGEAESLSTQLNTTSTLAIKQLCDSLDKGIRKRNRRLRSLRRIGFVLLEWALVGVMWWAWLIVMIFKIFRGISMGVVKSIRWILWV